MGGVGKTTLVTEVCKKVKREKLYNEGVMVTVSRNHIKTIQRDLAEKLGIKLEEENEDVRAGHLMMRLQQEKTILLILDDLWEELELAKVGIPNPYKGDHKGCKIIITSRILDVCKMMRCQVNIEVKVLSDQDSWSLFRMKTDGAIDSPDLQDVVRNVVKECGGLPLAIVTLGAALGNKDRLVWEDALQQLKNSSPSEIPGMQEKYMGWGRVSFLNVDTLEEAKRRLHTMVEKLKASSLLLKGEGQFGIPLSFGNINKEGQFGIPLSFGNINKEFVKMHDLVRDVAISIASNTNNGFLAKPNAGLEEWSEMEQLKQCKRISLMHNNISKFSGIPECPHIRTLLLQCNRDFNQIPDSFFKGMESLVVLDLSFTSISSLPTSISCLKNLQILNLAESLLRELSLEGLEKLKVLNLRGTYIPELPAEISRLSNLKLLDLTNTPIIKVPEDTISKLFRLEQLYMGDSFCNWEVFVICADEKFIDSELPSPRSMRLNIIWFKSNPISDWVKKLLEKTEELSLVGTMPFIEPTIHSPTSLVAQREEEYCRDSTSILQSDLLQRLQNLTELKVENCSHWKEVFRYEGRERDQALLSKLRKLKLENLLGVTRIWNGVGSFGTMHNLEKLLVIRCGSLSNIFSLPLSRSIQQLGKLGIEECHSMENIISVGDNKLQQLQSITIFQNLQKMAIIKCNKLKQRLPISLARGLQKLEVLSIRKCEEIKVIIAEEECLRCSNLKRFPLGPESAPNLDEIKADEKWFRELEWEDESFKSRLQLLLHDRRGAKHPFPSDSDEPPPDLLLALAISINLRETDEERGLMDAILEEELV
ncbi:hypothetical protein HHK36_018633 [Tetracentron sinense]|uniref:NB-ARC domain-containing protein n=1 Tax=Tetracentron sinense TaxID=13715 RepID=A0A834YYT7_TETSI|nr:hypothetical protein HHK36_018633 [Tetracentron sinense]